jgi:hypothetical protein
MTRSSTKPTTLEMSKSSTRGPLWGPGPSGAPAGARRAAAQAEAACVPDDVQPVLRRTWCRWMEKHDDHGGGPRCPCGGRRDGHEYFQFQRTHDSHKQQIRLEGGTPGKWPPRTFVRWRRERARKPRSSAAVESGGHGEKALRRRRFAR